MPVERAEQRGAGNAERRAKHWQHARKDREMFAEDARREIAQIKAGRGQPRLVALIDRIDGAA